MLSENLQFIHNTESKPYKYKHSNFTAVENSVIKGYEEFASKTNSVIYANIKLLQ